ncbi:MAG TPA: DNA polymerase IV [Casimicrobiaceae bacterium]
MTFAAAASTRLIAHLDMDAFYASVELLRYPELRGKPVVIGGGRRHQPRETRDPVTGSVTREFATLRGYAGRGVATTATYEARAFGVHSAMGLMKAAALAPDAILLPVDFDAYRKYSRLFKAAVRTLATVIEDRGIDEIYIDLTDVAPAGELRSAREPSSDDPWRRARDVAIAIKRAVRAATGLSCSIAVAPNKLLAKIASELDKPDGLTLLRPADIALRIWPLPPRKINGVGPKSSAKLEALGIRTIGELAQADPQSLRQQFGEHYGAWLHEAAHGRDERPVVTYMEPKSISRETTFERDLSARRDREALSKIFTELCAGVGDDLKRKGYVARTIGLKLRYDDFRTVTRDNTLAAPTQDARAIRHAAGECLKRVPLERRIRLLGVRATALTAQGAAEAEPPPAPVALPLFD